MQIRLGILERELTQLNIRLVPGDFTRFESTQERVVRPATWFTRAPKDYDPIEAATLTTAGLTAWRALVVNGRLRSGEVVLILGTGGVSLFALQIALAAGATVLATSSSDEKLERLRKLGASHTVIDVASFSAGIQHECSWDAHHAPGFCQIRAFCCIDFNYL